MEWKEEEEEILSENILLLLLVFILDLMCVYCFNTWKIYLQLWHEKCRRIFVSFKVNKSRDDCCMIIKQFFWIIFRQTNTHNSTLCTEFCLLSCYNHAKQNDVFQGKIWSTSSSFSIHRSNTLVWTYKYVAKGLYTYWRVPELFLYMLMNLATNSSE